VTAVTHVTQVTDLPRDPRQKPKIHFLYPYPGKCVTCVTRHTLGSSRAGRPPADESMPPTARVTACKVLLGQRDQGNPAADLAVAGDAVSVRAQQLLAARRRAN
jgi:hypothetical protein